MFNFLKKEETKKLVRFYIDQNTIEERMIWKIQKAWKRLVNKRDPNEIDEDMQMVLGRFMVNGDNEYLSEEDAIAVLDNLTSSEIRDAASKFFDTFNSLLIPKANGNSSRLPSEAGSPKESPNGSQP